MDSRLKNDTINSCLQLKIKNFSETAVSTLLQENSSINSDVLKNISLNECIEQVSRLNTYWFIIGGIGLSLLSILGILLNILSILTLRRPRMKCSINYLLIVLSISDTFVCINMLLRFGFYGSFTYLQIAKPYRTLFYPVVSIVLRPIGYSALTTSVFLTVMITFDRFVAVCYPLHARRLLRLTNAVAASVFVLLFALLYNLPRWFERKLVYNDTNFDYRIRATPLTKDMTYNLVYKVGSFFIIMYIIPLVIIFVLNFAIYRKIRELQKARFSKLTKENEDKLTSLLFAIVITFCICYILSGFKNLVDALRIESKSHYQSYVILMPTSNFLLGLIASSNCVLYYGFGRKFRSELCEMLRSYIPTRILQLYNKRLSIDKSSEICGSYEIVAISTPTTPV